MFESGNNIIDNIQSKKEAKQRQRSQILPLSDACDSHNQGRLIIEMDCSNCSTLDPSILSFYVLCVGNNGESRPHKADLQICEMNER
jgi:hypothetical protein